MPAVDKQKLALELELLELEEAEHQESQRSAPAAGNTGGSVTSAQQEFEQGNPRASFISDSGKQTYAQPVSTTAATATGALKGATSIPFVYESGARDVLSKTTGQSPQAAQDFIDAGSDQHPIASSLGEFAGAAVGAPKLIGEALVAGTVKAAQGLKWVAGAIEDGTVGLVARHAGKIGLPRLQKAASILSDAGSSNAPAVLRKTVNTIDEAKDVVGQSLETLYKQVEKAVPTQMLAETVATRGALASQLESNIIAKATGRGEELTKDFYPTLSAEIKNMLGTANENSLVSTTQKWKLAQQVEKRARTFSKANAQPADQAKADILNRLHVELRSMLSDDVTKAASITGDKTLISQVEAQSKAYGELATGSRLANAKLRVAQKPEQIQAASDRAAQILSHGPNKLGKYYKILQSAVPRGLAAVAAKSAFLMHNDPDYVDVINSLEPPQE